MKVAHLILAHKNPAQLERLLNALRHPSFDFYIHLDKKADITPFDRLANLKNVFFVQNRAKIYWAGYGTIQATINGFEEILARGRYDYMNVISAQDFPLKSAGDIADYINAQKGTEFITCQSMDDPEWNVGKRVRNYNLINWRIPGKYKLEKIINAILPDRKFPLDYDIVGRANWFTITTSATRYILDFLKGHPEVIRYFKYCWGADEFIFSTILYNSPFKEKIKDNLVYVYWPDAKTGHPKVLDKDDYEKLLSSGKLFARKFDTNHDETILQMLEEHIGIKSEAV